MNGVTAAYEPVDTLYTLELQTQKVDAVLSNSPVTPVPESYTDEALAVTLSAPVPCVTGLLTTAEYVITGKYDPSTR